MSSAVRPVVRLFVCVGLLGLLSGCAQIPRGSADFGAWSGPSSAFTWLDETQSEDAAQEVVASKSFLHRLGFWIPNRIFDVFDIARARVRVGPGFGIAVRATEFADVFAGAYATVFVGLWGPRGEARIPWPIYLETLVGAGVSVLEADVDIGFAPHYGLGEFGAGFHLALIGVDVGVDPLEIFDFVAGLFFFDPLGDDY